MYTLGQSHVSLGPKIRVIPTPLYDSEIMRSVQIHPTRSLNKIMLWLDKFYAKDEVEALQIAALKTMVDDAKNKPRKLRAKASVRICRIINKDATGDFTVQFFQRPVQ